MSELGHPPGAPGEPPGTPPGAPHGAPLGDPRLGLGGLLVHVCCAPCAAFPLTELLRLPEDPAASGPRPDPAAASQSPPAPALSGLIGPRPLVAWFYNPNIHPKEEHHRRRDAFAYLAARMPSLVPGGSVEADFSAPYEPKAFFLAASKSPDPPGRCLSCYRLRLKAAALEARRRGLSAFTTTLLYSRRQKHDLVAQAGREAALETGVGFLYRDFRGGWQEGIRLSKELGLYRQRWCGCAYEAGE